MVIFLTIGDGWYMHGQRESKGEERERSARERIEKREGQTKRRRVCVCVRESVVAAAAVVVCDVYDTVCAACW